MQSEELQQGRWYWVRRENGTIVPYRFHRVVPRRANQPMTGEFFVGSFIQTFSLGQVVGQADSESEINEQERL